MAFVLPPLPYAYNALEPYISSETLFYHHDKHHRAYLNKLNELLQSQDPIIDSPSLEYLIQNTHGPLFNQAAQTWNHTFYWNCMSAQHHQKPRGALLQAIEEKLGDYESFVKQMSQVALNQFASGWAWLVIDAHAQLKIMSTSNAANPLTDQLKPLLVIDVWEHAYYIDTRNNRSQYLEHFWSVVNWAFVEQNYQNALFS